MMQADLKNWQGKTVVVKYLWRQRDAGCIAKAGCRPRYRRLVAGWRQSGDRTWRGTGEITRSVEGDEQEVGVCRRFAVTDAETATLAEMALVEKTNPELVEFINRAGVRAVEVERQGCRTCLRFANLWRPCMRRGSPSRSTSALSAKWRRSRPIC